MDDFCKDATKWDDKKTHCRVCSNKNTKKWKIANASYVKQYHSKYNYVYDKAKKQEKMLVELVHITYSLAKLNDKYNCNLELIIKK